MSPLDRAAFAAFTAYYKAKTMDHETAMRFKPAIKAALQAIREPSEAMLDRAEDQEAQSARGTAGNMWRAMIDAALEEG